MKLRYLLFALIVVLYSACSKDSDPEVPNEEEVITTMTLTLTGGSGDVVLSFKDLDGDGGNAPTITGGTLDKNTSYTGNIVLLNESESPAENITEEIEEEADEHQFFFSSTLSSIKTSYSDTDSKGQPVGLKLKLETGDAGNGNLTVILRHEPNKEASGVSSGDITNAGGETDIEVTFPIEVK